MTEQSAETAGGGGSSAGPTWAETAAHPRPPTPHEPARERWRPSNLVLRLLTAAILIPPVLWACWYGGLPYVAVVIGFVSLGISEFYDFISAKGATPHRLLGVVAACALPLVVYVGDAFYATSFTTGILIGTMFLQLTKNEISEAIASVSATFFGIFYVGWLLAHAVSLRFIDEALSLRYDAVFDPQLGFFFIVFCLSSAVLSDVGAYFVGRRFGRHKLAPAISPNKSIEGAIGGLLVGALGAIAAKAVFDQFIPGQLARDLGYLAAGLFGVAIAAVSIIGDLIESVLKRDADLKDAGSLLPGVGGVLDRIDSALVAIPVTYYMLMAYYYSLYGF